MTAPLRYGYWMPVFGGWLRNVPDEQMEASWEYVRRLAIRSEQIGYDLTLIAELYLNDIKGAGAPTLEAWSTAAALAAVTERLELMVAVRPTFHPPALFAKQAANLDQIASGRLALNVVSSWWETEARQYGVPFDAHEDRYARTEEWLAVVDGLWREPRFSHAGERYQLAETVLSPKPAPRSSGTARPTVWAGGESDAAKTLIARRCDAYVMHGDDPARVGAKIADMRRHREIASEAAVAEGRPELPPLSFGMAAYTIVRDTPGDVARELARITTPEPGSAAHHSYEDWVRNTKLETTISRQDYSVSNRGLRAGLVGTPDDVADQLRRFHEAGVDLLLLQCSPQLEEMERFAAEVMPRAV